jgi:predicted O-linked N-acetylglucosamine transferase (SPINDLY family)
LQIFHFREAISALEHAESLGEVESLPRLLKAISWICDWKRYEVISYKVEHESKICYAYVIQNMAQMPAGSSLAIVNFPQCKVDSTLGLEFTNVNGTVQKLFIMNSPNAKSTLLQCELPSIPSSFDALLKYNHMHKHNSHNNKNRNVPQSKRHRLKIGILSSDFGVHPVSSLIRGGLQFIDRSRIEMFCYSLNPDLSYWGTNISQIVEHFHVLGLMNTFDAARIIASHDIDILIDLNGHTLHTGLTVMKHKPAHLQLSFLGLPTTTGAPFIDYYLSDWVSTPAEISDHFTEKMLLMPPCYIVNGTYC